MKKYLWLGLVTSLLMIAIGVGGSWLSPRPAEVSLHTIRAQTLRRTVRCGGVICPAETLPVYATTPCVVSAARAAVGQHVSGGDALFAVDAEATREVLAGQTAAGLSAADLSDTIRAVFSGTVAGLTSPTAALTAVDKPLALIRPDAAVQVTVAVREQDLPQVAVGQPVTVSGNGFSAVYSGVLAALSTTADTPLTAAATGAVTVGGVVLLDGTAADAALRTGLTATAEILTAEQPDQIVVPYECLLQDDDGTEYVYRQEGNRAVRQTVRTGWELGDGVQVLDGLSDGDRLVIEPERLDRQETVWITEAVA